MTTPHAFITENKIDMVKPPIVGSTHYLEPLKESVRFKNFIYKAHKKQCEVTEVWESTWSIFIILSLKS